ncbi:unnamed protein product [Owenia fusiformis]|uniref:RanBD1 domain-containing protein n=1 Tax=Owenia fusiformis TaxID=6347 RepID=A0A8S4N4T6_OWEFU|nr:unnamed protein product [Owenia fusiformis]
MTSSQQTHVTSSNMSEIKTESANKQDITGEKDSKGFVFGENMSDRAFRKPGDEPVPDTNGSTEVVEGSDGVSDSVVTAPSNKSPTSTTNPAPQSTGGGGFGILAPSKVNPNPFAVKAPTAQSMSSPYGSDSEEEKKDRPIVAPSTLGSGMPSIVVTSTGADTTTSEANSSIFKLKPSGLSSTADQLEAKRKTGFQLRPSTLKGPAIVGSLGDSGDKKSPEVSSSTDKAANNEEEVNKRLFGDVGDSGNTGLSDSTSSFKSTESGKFLFGQNMEDRVSSDLSASNSGSGFVFGEKLSERVIADKDPKDSETGEKASSPTSKSPTGKTLEESAKEYEARQVKPEYQKVQVRTGEEEESNVLQASVKLFIFDKDTQNWQEKGRGLIRLNDIPANETRDFQSRLVMRTQGTLCVILNTNLWPGMMVEKASVKSVKITAIVDGEVRIFLIMTSHKDADQLFQAIDWRVKQLKTSTTSTNSADTTPPLDNKDTISAGEKRVLESPEPDSPPKKLRRESDGDIPVKHSEVDSSNSSGTIDPETEASGGESISSSPTIKSTSPESQQ